MNWDDPVARLALMERVGADRYNELLTEHHKSLVVETVNGYDIKTVNTAFGTLFAVVGTNQAFRKIEQARSFASLRPDARRMEIKP